jgi:hypothetical protein
MPAVSGLDGNVWNGELQLCSFMPKTFRGIKKAFLRFASYN